MESEEKLCVKVLRTLQQMLLKKAKYGDRVSAQAGGMPAGLARGSRGSGPGRAGQWLHGEMYQCGASLPPLQGNQLRKMLLQNYLQNRKSSSRGDLPDPVGAGQYCLPLPCLWAAHWPRTWALPPLPRPIAPLKRIPLLQAWTKTGQRLQPPSADWTRRGPPSWCVTSSPAPRTRRSSRRASAWPSACWTAATPRSRCGVLGLASFGRVPPAQEGDGVQFLRPWGPGCWAGCWRPLRVWLPVGGSTSHIGPLSHVATFLSMHSPSAAACLPPCCSPLCPPV